MEISGGQPSTSSHHTQATSSSVIVQSSQPEEGVSLTSLSDIHQLHHHHHHQQQQQQQAASASITGLATGSISSPHPKLHSLQQSHLHAQQTPPHFGATRTPSIQQASSSSASSPILSPPGKTLGRNNNGTSKFRQTHTHLNFPFSSTTNIQPKSIANIGKNNQNRTPTVKPVSKVFGALNGFLLFAFFFLS